MFSFLFHLTLSIGGDIEEMELFNQHSESLRNINSSSWFVENIIIKTMMSHLLIIGQMKILLKNMLIITNYKNY